MWSAPILPIGTEVLAVIGAGVDVSGWMRPIRLVLMNQHTDMRTGRRREWEVGRNNDSYVNFQTLILASFNPVSGKLDVVIRQLNDFDTRLPQLVCEELGPD